MSRKSNIFVCKFNVSYRCSFFSPFLNWATSSHFRHSIETEIVNFFPFCSTASGEFSEAYWQNHWFQKQVNLTRGIVVTVKKGGRKVAENDGVVVVLYMTVWICGILCLKTFQEPLLWVKVFKNEWSLGNCGICIFKKVTYTVKEWYFLL